MRIILCTFFCLCFMQSSFAQPNFTANDIVPDYDTPFRLSINPNFNGSQWTDQQLANLAAGNAAEGVEGVGVKSFRVPLPESFLDFWGYDIRLDAFQHYYTIDMKDNTVFLESPSNAHIDLNSYCPGTTSLLFANMYEPIWDNGANGTPVNDDNYAALYIYKTVSLYKDYVKFWEIWNEPDFDYSSTGWFSQDMPGNWYDNVPSPCDIKIFAPVYHYIRLLRISYEVIKTVDPDAFVTTGGLGYHSFLDVILRHTDNPDGGQVTAEYPLKGGAYFDVMSYHVYPHIDGSMREWSDSIQGWDYSRHSDAALDGAIDAKIKFEDLLFQYGYDGQTFPKKRFIVTETTIPRKPFNEELGSDAAARNYAIKLQVAAYQNNIQKIAIYQLSDQATFSDATNWLDMSGLYQQISTQQPYTVTPNESGIGCRTTTQFLWEKDYHETMTQALDLPNNIRGGAFVSQAAPSDTIFVLWAKTETDQTEAASATYSFPQSFSFVNVEKMNWDFSVTNVVDSVSPQDVQLTGDPVFLKGIVGEITVVDSSGLDLINKVWVQPNPFYENLRIKFELEETKNVKLEMYNVQGIKIYEWIQNDLPMGEHTILIEEEAEEWSAGMYFGKLSLTNKRPLPFKVLKF